MKKRVVIFGTGGQGVKTIGHILAQAVFNNRFWPHSYPSYTPAARGEGITSSIVISDQPEDYPLVETADWIFMLAPSQSLESFKSKIGEKTRFVASQEIVLPATIKDENIIRITIKKDVFSLNLFILGVIQGLLPEIETASFELAVKKILGDKNFDKNMESFREGQSAVRP